MKIDWDKVWHGYAIWAGIRKPENLLPPLPWQKKIQSLVEVQLKRRKK